MVAINGGRPLISRAITLATVVWLTGPGAAAAGPEATAAPIGLVVVNDQVARFGPDYFRPAVNTLTRLLGERGCQAAIRVVAEADPAELVFQSTPRTTAEAGSVALIALNFQGELPVPVWVTRQTSGVRSLAELENRDLAVLEEGDLLGYTLPLRVLANHGVTPDPSRLYKASSYSAALGLLLHNNTHGAVSEQGLVKLYGHSNGLSLTFVGEPAPVGSWYLGAGVAGGDRAAAAGRCVHALGELDRDHHRQAFALFSEWIYRFAPSERVTPRSESNL